MNETSEQIAAPPPLGWAGRPTSVAKPRLLVMIVSAAFASGLLAVISLVFLNQALQSQPRSIAPEVSYKLGEALTLADWASSGGLGPELYVIGFPSCPNCAAFKKQELKRYLAAGVEVRAIEFAPRRPDGASAEEEAKAADVSRTRSWAAYLATSGAYSGMVTGDIEYVERGRNTVVALEEALKASHADIAFPAFFWRKPGKGGDEWRFVLGSSPQATDNVLKELRKQAAS